jgi:hypothetical protein
MTRVESLKIFSAYPSRRRKTVLLLSLLYPFPFQFRNFFQELLQGLVITDCLANAFLQMFRDKDLTQFTLITVHEIKGGMQFPGGTPTVRLPALSAAQRQAATKQSTARSELRHARTEIPLGGRKLGPVQRGIHV